MDLRTQFEKETGHNRAGIELAATETSAYIRWLESRYQSQSTRIRELEVALGRVVRAYNETGEVASAIRGCEQSLNKKGAVRRKRNQGAK